MKLKSEPETPWRRWTDAELHKLFRDYFDKLPGTCPVCGHEVAMMMDHKDNATILSIQCRFCGNSSTVFA
jgi:transcription elongation factor Elf1